MDDSAIVEAQGIWKKGMLCVASDSRLGVEECPPHTLGDQLNRQHAPSMDHSELARETERLDRKMSSQQYSR